MPAKTPPNIAALRRSAIESARATGTVTPYSVAARALTEMGYPVSSGTLCQWDKTYAPPDPAIKAAMDAVKTDMTPVLAWAKTKPDEAGHSFSVLLKPVAQTGQSVIDQIAAAFHGLTAAPIIPPPLYSDSDLLTIYPIADAHIGAMAWGKETGEDYGTRTAAERVKSWVARCVASSPESQTAIVLGVGDALHADDQTNLTPGSKHQLDVDTRHFKTLEVAIAAFAASVDCALTKHAHVIVRILPGNHDKNSYMALLFALAERYRDNPRATVQTIPGEYFMHEHGRVMIAAQHGDKAKAERIVMFLADEYPEAWGRTRHRFLFTGHLHSHKSADIGGVQWEQLRAVTARDAYTASHAYTSRAQLQAITYHRDRGEVQRVKVGV